MTKAKKQNRFPIFNRNLLPLILAGLLFILLGLLFNQFLEDKFYPITFAGDSNISFLTKAQAARVLESNFQKRAGETLLFRYPEGTFQIDLRASKAGINYQDLNLAFQKQRNTNFWGHLEKESIRPQITLSLEKELSAIASSINKPPKNAELIFDESPGLESTGARIQIKEDAAGLSLDKEKILLEIQNFLLTGEYWEDLPLTVTYPEVTTAYVLEAKKALENSEKNPVRLAFEEKSWTIDTKQLLTLLDLKSGGSLLSYEQTKAYLTYLASEIDQDVKEGLFDFNRDTKRVTAFVPSREGRKLNIDKTYLLISGALNKEDRNISLPVETVKPKIETSDINSLGIRELLGRGASNFSGSIENRIYNINLTASKINGVLIAPDEIFSFNKTVGDISAATGFKQAYVIKEGRTVLDDGGGVCQDSTTLFRAVLNAGLPIVKRTAHAYRVSYYEQGFPPGLDATVFYPSVDFQFKNDTGHHILIQAYTQGTALYVDLYGTSDGRVASLTKPVVANLTPPPPELRQDDPALSRGTVKQVDWAAWGATVTFVRTVIRNGEILANETWKSNYKPWQAVYLVGTKE